MIAALVVVVGFLLVWNVVMQVLWLRDRNRYVRAALIKHAPLAADVFRTKRKRKAEELPPLPIDGAGVN